MSLKSEQARLAAENKRLVRHIKRLRRVNREQQLQIEAMKQQEINMARYFRTK